MNDFLTAEEFEDLRSVFGQYGIYLRDVELNQESVNMQSFGGAHNVTMPGQQELQMTMIANLNAFQSIIKMKTDLKCLRRIQDSTNPAVQDQFEKLVVLMELTNDT